MSDTAPSPSGTEPGSPRLSTDDVAKVAQLALLELSDNELNTFTGQLAAVLDLADELNQFDTDNVAPTAHPFGLFNVFREDVPVDELEGGDRAAELRAEALAAGPDVEENQFKVPPALGEAP